MLPSHTIDPLDELKSMFTYEDISTTRALHDEDYTFGSRIEDDTDFIRFAYIGEDLRYKPKLPSGARIFPPGGWKLHIAIDDTDPENVASAWDIVKDILIEQRIAESKVIKQGKSFVHDEMQCGKQITIYQFFNPERNWSFIINSIERRLLSAGIRSVPFSPTDKPIPDSHYITYRNDLSEDGRRAMDSREVMTRFPLEKRYNPFGHLSSVDPSRIDPFINIRIEPQRTLSGGLSAKP